MFEQVHNRIKFLLSDSTIRERLVKLFRNYFQPYLKLKVSRLETKCFTVWNEVFHTEKRIVSSLETIFETNRHRWRDGEVIALHPQTPYSSERQRKGERGDGKMENKYPVGKFIRCCNDSVLYRNEYYFISSLLLFLIINSYRMLYLKNLPPRKLSFPYLYTLPQSCVVA